RREQELSALQRTLLDNTLAGILIVRRRRIVSANRQCARMLGYGDPAELVGLSTRSLCVDDDEFQRIGRLYAQLWRGERVHAMDVRIRRRDGSEVLFDAAAGIAGLRASRSTVWTFVDVTERARLQHQLRHDALHDILSDLPNRRALDEFLPRALARAQRRGKVVAVGVLDLDDFKPVNDTYGHDAGDALLRELARRLGRSMRKSDMLARLGGDEFVVVLDDLDEATLQTQLQRLATRLHRAVEAPFALGGERQAHIGMTLGLATFPRDGADADVLLRHADAALYQLKARKRDRTTWWQYGVLAQAAGVAADETSDDAGEPDAYGAESARMLHEYAAVVRGAVAAFVRSVYTGSGAYGGFAAALRHFDSAELAGLERRHAEHLEALFSARTTRGEVDARAKQLGRAQALVGIQPAQLIEPTGSLRQMLAQACASSGLASGPRHRLLRAVEQRLQDDLQGQLRAAHRTMGAYFKVLNHDACAPATLWRDALRGLVEPIGALPGILACVVLRPNARGRFEVEAAAGPQAERLSSAMAAADYAVHLEPQEPARKGLVSEAWRTRQLQTSAHLERDPRVATWHEVFQAAGGRSAVAVPIIAEHGRCALVVWLLGAYPNQFDAAWVTPFIRSLQYRAAQAWNSTRAAASHVLSQDVAQDWRDRLLDGGLDMHVQPVVDLLTGECLRVEALARLRLAGGRIVAPAAFLPILGEQELDWLFRSGLEQVCARLQAWDREGLRVDAAINLPPSCLLNPACAQWVQAALELHGIESSRLTIELLETQGIEFEAQNLALRSLQALGVKLAMDDLGAGYSSLQRLAQLPFDTIKIDQGLLLNLRKDPLQTLSLVRAIVRLAAELGRTLVVEGVEDRGAIEAAVQCGARYAQGYGIARPMPAEQFAAWLRDFRLRPGAEEVHTSLGMLARCRRLEPRDAGDTPPRTGDAVPHFLRVRELQHAGLADWYAQLSARMAAAGASRAWIDWLVREVALEAGPAEPPTPGRAPAAPRAPRRQANC
ncbi:MAG: EAL domain-containing protein, partial [Betaproteobacteria bacterium]|nr:EAL domain-containing protein [Betaproteobacteria bacterium]